MRKKLLVLCLSFAMAVSATACTSEKPKDEKSKETDKKTESGSDAIYERAKADYYGKITLADYSDFVVYSSEVDIDEESIQQTIDGLMQGKKEYTKSVDEVTNECQVDISYVGTIDVDGKPYEFPGGTAENQTLDIANSNYIPGFAEGLVGAKVGDTVTLDLTFPDGYGSTKDADGNDIPLSNVPVKFKVTINSANEGVIPELTDDYAKENFNKYVGCNNVEELKEYFRDYEKMDNVGSAGAVTDYMDKCEFEANEEHVNADLKLALESFDSYCEQNTVNKDDYYAQKGLKDEEEFKQKTKEALIERYKLYAIVCAVAEKEGIELTKEIYDERLSQLATQNNTTVEGLESQIKESQNMSAEEYFPVQFLYQDVIKFLIKNANVKDGERPTEAPTDADAESGAEEQSEEAAE